MSHLLIIFLKGNKYLHLEQFYGYLPTIIVSLKEIF
jgi:hypothetical protein